jgi:hypothetical protein
MPQWLTCILAIVDPLRSAAPGARPPAKPGFCIFSCCSNPGATLCHTGTAPQDIAPLDKKHGGAITTHRSSTVYGGKSRFLCRYRDLR